MKNTLNNKNYINIYQYFGHKVRQNKYDINIYQYFGHKVRQAERPPQIDEIIILYVYTKCLLEKNPSLIHKLFLSSKPISVMKAKEIYSKYM